MAEVLVGTVTNNNGMDIKIWASESGGNTTFRIDVVKGYADFGGFFFDYRGGAIAVNDTGDNAYNQNDVLILNNTAVTASYMGTAADGDDITRVGDADVNLNGAGEVFDAGVQLGTSGIARDDIGSVTFTINGLTLSEIEGQAFGIRAMSVGATTTNRTDSVKLIGHFAPDLTAPSVAISDDEAGTANIAGGDVVYTFQF